jgi:hypothetical protein
MNFVDAAGMAGYAGDPAREIYGDTRRNFGPRLRESSG